MIYIIPTHQNPTGNTTPIEDRWKLVDIAHQFGILIVADEVYHLLDWSSSNDSNDDSNDYESDLPSSLSSSLLQNRRRPARMAVLNSYVTYNEVDDNDNTDSTIANNNSNNNNQKNDGCCITVSSFTKIFAPGIRCGWIEGPSHIIKPMCGIGYIVSQGGCTPFIGEIMRTALQERICDNVLHSLNDSFKHRCNLLCDILKTESGIRIDTIPQGGYFLWISFTGIDDVCDFREYCQSRGVSFLAGRRCDTWDDDDDDTDDSDNNNLEAISGLPRNASDSWARLCFADLDERELKDGANLLIQCYREFIS